MADGEGMQLRYKDFSFPRWLIFVGMLVPAWWLGRGIVKVIVFVIEGAFFTQKRALYYIMGTKVSQPHTSSHGVCALGSSGLTAATSLLCVGSQKWCLKWGKPVLQSQADDKLDVGCIYRTCISYQSVDCCTRMPFESNRCLGQKRHSDGTLQPSVLCRFSAS